MLLGSEEELAWIRRQNRLTLAILSGAIAGLSFAAFFFWFIGPVNAGTLPDPKLTPGVVRTDISANQVCKIKWGKDQRMVTAAMKRQVMAAYHFKPSDCPSGKVEMDHLISRELLGADDNKNLWPQCYEKDVKTDLAFGAHRKDRVENRLHQEVCLGHMTLVEAQSEIRTDWTKAYIHYFGQPK